MLTVAATHLPRIPIKTRISFSRKTTLRTFIPRFIFSASAAALCTFTVLPARVHAAALAYTVTDLGILSGTDSFGYGINASGQVAGYANTAGNSAMHAVRWTGTTAEDLGTLSGAYSFGYSINASGQVAGYAITDSFTAHAVRWTGTTPEDLGTLGGSFSFGYGINDSGQVAGYSHTNGNSAIHAVRWTDTTPTDLGTLGGSLSEGYGINATGDVTGMSHTTGNATYAAFLYTGGTMYDLNTLLLPGSGATDLFFYRLGNSINDLGQIAVSGAIGGQQHALLLTPVPERSSTLAMMMLSCFGLFGCAELFRPAHKA